MISKKTYLIVPCVVALATSGWMPAASAQAAVINIPSTGAATLFQGDVNNSLGVPGIYVGTDSTGSFKDGLLAFNVSSIPSDATITSVTLDLYVGIVAGSGGNGVTNSGAPRTISLFDESQAWGPSTNAAGASSFGGHGGGSPANPGDATWNDASYNSNSALATPWSTGSAGNIIGSSVALATTSNIPGTTYSEVQWTSSAPDTSADLDTEVQEWIENPTSNNGLAVVNANSTGSQSFLGFYSAQGALNANNGDIYAPDLVVTYAVPEPASLAMLGAGAAGLLLRRRRACRQ